MRAAVIHMQVAWLNQSQLSMFLCECVASLLQRRKRDRCAINLLSSVSFRDPPHSPSPCAPYAQRFHPPSVYPCPQRSTDVFLMKHLLCSLTEQRAAYINQICSPREECRYKSVTMHGKCDY